MTYSKYTEHFDIPYMQAGDVLTEEGEYSQWNIVDGILYAMSLGLKKMILREGNYSLIGNESKRLIMEPLNGVSFVGIINKRLCYSRDVKTSTVLTNDAKNYVYVVYSSSLDIDSSSFTLVASTEKKNNSTHLLVATINLQNGAEDVDLTTDKIYSTNFDTHINNDTNPHGVVLHQHSLNCSIGEFNNLSIGGNDILSSVYVKLVSAGDVGVDWSLSGYMPKFATVYGEEEIGEVFWVINEGVLTIKNSGDIGINMSVKIDVEKE